MLTTEHDLAVMRRRMEEAQAVYERSMEQSGLSPMERVVARGLLKDMSNKEIAADIGISHQTFKVHISRINAKLGTHDRLQIVLRLLGMRVRR